MRKSDLYLFVLAAQLSLFGLIFVHSAYRGKADEGMLRERMELVKKLELTDLCLFTEANYTRHLSQADWHAPFQDSPLSLEHFPSGSLIQPPASLRKKHGLLD